jgi:hypothetical protein
MNYDPEVYFWQGGNAALPKIIDFVKSTILSVAYRSLLQDNIDCCSQVICQPVRLML